MIQHLLELVLVPLISKNKEMSDCKVVFNGDGSDEYGGYMDYLKLIH